MDLRKLQIFVEVAQLCSFSAAAQSLHIAQSAVSIAVRKLELELDTQLLDRSGRVVTLTVAGEDLLTRAQSILREVDDLQNSVSAMNHLLRGELTLACPSMLATYYLPDLLSGFLSLHPGLTASVSQAGTKRVEEMLLQNEIEIGVTASDDVSPNAELELIPLVSDEIVLCVANGHPWSQRSSINVSELHQSPMVVYESGYFIRSKLEQLAAAQGVKPEFRLQSNFLPLLIKMVKQGLGSTVGLKIMADQEPGITGISLSPPGEIRMALAKRRGRPISRANQSFLDWVSSRYDEPQRNP